MKGVMTIRVEPGVREKLEKLARATARSKSFLIGDAINEYLDLNAWQLEAIEEGIRQADAGKLKDHRDIRRKWEKRIGHKVD